MWFVSKFGYCDGWLVSNFVATFEVYIALWAKRSLFLHLLIKAGVNDLSSRSHCLQSLPAVFAGFLYAKGWQNGWRCQVIGGHRFVTVNSLFVLFPVWFRNTYIALHLRLW